MTQSFDICVRGAGIVGQTLALLLAREKFRVALVGNTRTAVPSPQDVRAYALNEACLLYTSPSPRDRQKSRMPSSA